FPWLSLGIGNALLLLYIFGGFAQYYTPDNPLTIPLILVVNLVFIVPYSREKWIEVVYAGENDQSEHTYFTLASQLGWWRAPETDERLHEGIRSALEGRAAPGQAQIGPAAAAPATAQGAQSQESVTVVCEECGRECVFLARHFGTVQQCP